MLLLGGAADVPAAPAPSQGIKPAEYRTPRGGRVWIYLPEAAPTNRSLACVLVPPAGSRLFHGMDLSAEDRAEQIPYAQAGFAVVSFDISGPTSETGDTKALRAALRAFRAAEYGIRDAFEALALAREKYPQIDRRRIYVSGHSSAATLALQIATSTNQVSACVAFAPICDLESRLGVDGMATLDRWVPGTSAGLREASPKNRVTRMSCPVFLFHALDDDNVPAETVVAFKNTLLRNQAKVEYVAVSSGGHYESMISQGLPKAIQWIRRMDEEFKKQH